MRAYALKHPGIRHRELAWRMVDEEVAYLSPSTVYRILKVENLVCPWRRRNKRTREEEEKAKRADEICRPISCACRLAGGCITS